MSSIMNIRIYSAGILQGLTYLGLEHLHKEWCNVYVHKNLSAAFIADAIHQLQWQKLLLGDKKTKEKIDKIRRGRENSLQWLSSALILTGKKLILCLVAGVILKVFSNINNSMIVMHSGFRMRIILITGKKT